MKAVVTMERSAYGNLQPTVTVRRVNGFRNQRAALLELAAKVERATPDREGWIVQIDNDRSVVFLELADATEVEAARGKIVLETAVRQ